MSLNGPHPFCRSCTYRYLRSQKCRKIQHHPTLSPDRILPSYQMLHGTAPDPVPKAMELLPLGPVVIIDTPGLDDIGELGELRVKKAYQILNKTDIAVLVIDASLGMTPEDLSILKKIQDKKIPYVVVKNKSDLCSSAENGAVCPNLDSMSDASFHIDASNSIEVSTVTGYHVHELKKLIASQAPEEDTG